MLKIDELKKSKNIAELLDEEQLGLIGRQAIQGYELDEESRSEWKEIIDKAMEIAKQTPQVKNHPWANASNVKYPLITQASIDFAARILPELINNDRIVQVRVIGEDVDGEKIKRGHRISKFLSYQLLQDSGEWEDDMDSMLHVLPILGTVFKKVYYDPTKKRPVSELCNPEDVIVNYGVNSLESARRVTHVMKLYANDVIERIRRGYYLDINVDLLKMAEGYEVDDEDPQLEIMEQHCYIDLDGDDYKEPYIVTFHKETGQVLRIFNRFKKIEKNGKGEIIQIDPEMYFVDYHFIKSPDGGFYSMGLGALLYPLNAAINTLINQLIDSGTLNNTQGGFVGRGLRLKNGEFKLRLGEWKVLDAASGINIAQNIVPLPTKEPSSTLFQLLGMLIEMGKDLSSTNDALQGKQPAQNVPATTILTLVEQGLKVFNGINKRIYRGLKKEFRRVYDLDRRFLSDADYLNVLDDPAADFKKDFEKKRIDILPVSDPSMSSDAQRLAKAQAIMSIPMVDQQEAGRFYLNALQVSESEIEKLIPAPDPKAPPPPEHLKILAEVDKLSAETKAKTVEAEISSEGQVLEAQKLQIQEYDAKVRGNESAERIMKMKQDSINNTAKVELAGAKADHQATMEELDFTHQKEKDEIELSIKAIDVTKPEETSNDKS